jgi:hypothetical protein
MEIFVINGFSFTVLHKEDDWRIVKNVSTFQLTGSNDSIFLYERSCLFDLTYINEHIESLSKSKFRNDYLTNKIKQLKKAKSIIEANIRESRIDSVLFDHNSIFLAC